MVFGVEAKVIQLTAIVDGKRATRLTEEAIEQAEQSCIDRFGADRFQGFAPIPSEVKAKSMWAEYKGRRISREELEAWLKLQDDESDIRAELNRLRG